MDQSPGTECYWKISPLLMCSATALLHNICKAAMPLDIHCNSGTTMTDNLPGYGTVWYHPNGITNILSLGWV